MFEGIEVWTEVRIQFRIENRTEFHMQMQTGEESKNFDQQVAVCFTF